MSKKEGYIPIFRKFFSHYLWEENREFSKAEAWIDCLQMARYKEDTAKKLVSGSLIEWNYGEFPASIRFLKTRWGWGSNTKVQRFLNGLEADKMIVLKRGHPQNIISVCNYANYDISKRDEEDTEKTRRRRREDAEKTQRRQNSKKEERKKERRKKERETRALDFLETNNPHLYETNFLMKYQSRIKNFEKFTEDFNDTVDVEQLDYTAPILFARLGKFSRNWIDNQKRYSSPQSEKNTSDNIPIG